MLANNLTSSGASREYVNQDGDPGLGLFTSLSHPWGGAPTYLTTAWVAGLRPTEGMGGMGIDIGLLIRVWDCRWN